MGQNCPKNIHFTHFQYYNNIVYTIYELRIRYYTDMYEFVQECVSLRLFFYLRNVL